MMRVALGQINVSVGDFEGNVRKITEYTKLAKHRQADLIAFPELAICGYPPEDLLLKAHFIEDNLKALRSLAKQVSGIIVVVGFVDIDAKKNLYNAAAVLANGVVKGVYHKMKLPNYGVFDEKRYFSNGTRKVLFGHGKTFFGVNICEDIWQEDGPYQWQSQAGAKVMINISSSPYYAGKGCERGNLLKKRAKETKTFVCYVNLIGGQDELVFDGASAIVDPRGKVLAAGKQFQEDLIMADLPCEKTTRKAKGVAYISLMEKDLLAKKIPLESHLAKWLGSTEEIYSALVLGVKDYVRKNGFKKVVVGLSGGIDSALVAVIAKDALGAENVTTISMPSRFSSNDTRSDAKTVAENLKVPFLEIPIEGIYEAYLKTLEIPFADTKQNIAEENIQARIRGNLLMAFSNKFGWLVLTTGNKSEIATGYCTLYGDMAGGFAVIKDVPKTTVYELARFCNQAAGKDIIPPSILDRAPTAELRLNQTDQDTLPPYDVLDRILKDYVEYDKSLSQIGKKENHDIVVKVMGMVDQSEYKRRQSPPGIKITPKAFGKDRRLPITNRYREY